MFVNALGEQSFLKVAEFIRTMEANRDFFWWATKLVVEETKELREALNEAEENPGQVFRELGDLAYVCLGFYATMPANPHLLLTEEQNNQVQKIFEEANKAVFDACQNLRIPVELVEAAISIIHDANMTKINPETGKPDRREDGKILKGPNYVAPDMTGLVESWKQFLANVDAKAAENAETETNDKKVNSLGTETPQ